ncbi:hypothetical protein [Lacimicrobium alkaliphilum]|uniref:Uncharacterized protein n=1 Tax=Lacimicrobium alkaliphilum TaxID=1526571 RepID=A0ABQ1RJP9_9ALTE|nr:hypothetical protein [Lacimicrobium alkaliphilum]GGD69957.1 hypothetical protein GCM10011357_26230 [Lacimicrobium alkaliphilum]
MIKKNIKPISGLSQPSVRLALALAAIATISSGCSRNEQSNADSTSIGTEVRQTAFRIRADADAALNSDSGWAAATNQNATIDVDSPFRVRFEVESVSEAQQQHAFSLEYKYNDGLWQPLLAEDFPYPIKDYALEFSDSNAADARNRFNIINGDNADFIPDSEDNSHYLKVKAADQPLLALGRYDTRWEAVEYGALLRLSEGNTAGVVFGYHDAQNYLRVDASAGGDINLVKVAGGAESVISSQPFAVKTGQWIQIKIARQGSNVEVEYEWDDIVQGLSFSTDTAEQIPDSRMGLYLPAGNSADIETFEVEGQTASPRVSIIASQHFDYGDPTEDLIDNSALPFREGSGISYGDTTPGWSASKEHGEWEFPIVIRYFSDGANRNLTGDTFAFRLTDASGEPLTGAATPTITANVPDGHIGGTFVETPVRIGPWEASNGDLYVLMEPSETDNMMMMVKSEDGGKSWFEADGDNRPQTGDLEGVAQTKSGNRIHTLHQTSEHVFYHLFRTSDHPEKPDTWAITDEQLASPVEPPTQMSDLAVRSDGSVVGVYATLEKLLYKIRTPDGTWGKQSIVDADLNPALSGPMVVLGKDDVVHFAYTGTDGTAWYRRILPDGTLSQRQKVASDTGTDVETNGAILPLVYLPQSDTVTMVYRLSNGELWERTANSAGELSDARQVTSHAVVTNAADSEQVGADAVGFGSDVHVLYIEQASGRIYYTYRDDSGNWHQPELQVEGVNALWVRGQIIKRTNSGAVYGYVYDAGSYGGSGMNKYSEVVLPASD